MEFEQLVKRIEWLDEEHRKTRAGITRLEERMAALEANIDTVAKQLKPLPNRSRTLPAQLPVLTSSMASSPNSATT